MCDICRKNPCDFRCPNFGPPIERIECAACGYGIYAGEAYIENDSGECAHFECFNSKKDMLYFLGVDIKEREVSLC